MPEVSRIVMLFSTCAWTDTIPAGLVCLAEQSLPEWHCCTGPHMGTAGQRGRRTSKSESSFHLDFHEVRLAYYLSDLSHACLPQQWLACHYLHVMEIILLTGERSKVGGRKEKMFLACLLPTSHAKFSYFSVLENKTKPQAPPLKKPRMQVFRRQLSSAALYQVRFMASQSAGQFLKTHSQSGKVTL